MRSFVTSSMHVLMFARYCSAGICTYVSYILFIIIQARIAKYILGGEGNFVCKQNKFGGATAFCIDLSQNVIFCLLLFVGESIMLPIWCMKMNIKKQIWWGGATAPRQTPVYGYLYLLLLCVSARSLVVCIYRSYTWNCKHAVKWEISIEYKIIGLILPHCMSRVF